MRDIGDHTSEFYSAGPLEFEPVADEPVNMDRAFDAALADVDLTFERGGRSFRRALCRFSRQGDLDRELALSLDDGFAATLSGRGAVSAVAEAEMSLEDELNALLGNSSASRSAPAVNAGLAAAPVSYAAPVARRSGLRPGRVQPGWPCDQRLGRSAQPGRRDELRPQPSISYVLRGRI